MRWIPSSEDGPRPFVVARCKPTATFLLGKPRGRSCCVAASKQKPKSVGKSSQHGRWDRSAPLSMPSSSDPPRPLRFYSLAPEGERHAGTFQLRLGGLGVGDGLARLVRLQPRLLQRDLCGALRRARLVDLLCGDKTGPEQRLHPPQRARSERPLRLGADDAARSGIGLGGLRRDLIGGQGEPCLEALYRRASLVHAHSIWLGVDPEQHVAL